MAFPLRLRLHSKATRAGGVIRLNNMNKIVNIFFQCIYNLPGYKDVVGTGTKLTISLNLKDSEKAMEQIEVLCRRWNTGICA